MFHFKTDTTDFDAIQQLAEKIWPVAYSSILSPEQLRYMLDLFYSKDSLEVQHQEKKHRFIIAQDETDLACGFASFSVVDEITNRFRLQKLYVLPQMQGRGLGKTLIQQIVQQIKKDNPVWLELNVNRYNSAFYFYQKNGFKVVREEDIEIGNGYFMNDYVMERQY